MIPIQELEPRQQAEVEHMVRGEANMIAILGIARSVLEEGRMNDELSNINIEQSAPITTPLEIVTKYPLSQRSIETVKQSRNEIESIITNPTKGKKLIAVVGPCSIHDEDAAIEYAHHVATWREKYGDRLEIVMRAYFEKPRTTVGWEGLIEDPDLDGSYNKNKGLEMSRRIVSNITDLGVPVATELVNTDTPQYLDDGISLGAIGARTVESQPHRKLASGVSFATGFKNGTGGSIDIAVDAITSAAHQHHMDGTDMLGRRTRYFTKGNQHGFLILRGGKQGPNFDQETVRIASEKLNNANVNQAIMVDCSHKNKVDGSQSDALRSIVDQVASGNPNIIGLMLESNLKAGAQKVRPGAPLEYGVSVTDECESIKETMQHLAQAYYAVGKRTKTTG